MFGARFFNARHFNAWYFSADGDDGGVGPVVAIRQGNPMMCYVGRMMNR